MEGGCEGLFQGQISGNLCEFVFDNISSPRRARQDSAVLLDLLEPVYHCNILISRSSPLTPRPDRMLVRFGTAYRAHVWAHVTLGGDARARVVGEGNGYYEHYTVGPLFVSRVRLPRGLIRDQECTIDVVRPGSTTHRYPASKSTSRILSSTSCLILPASQQMNGSWRSSGSWSRKRSWA